MSAWEEYKKKHTLNSGTKTSPWEEYKNSRTVKSSLSVGSDAQSKSDLEDYETKKVELKAAADAEQAQVLSPDNLLLKSFVTHGSPSTITQGMQGIFQYINWLKQSPEYLKYNQYTAAEQEEEKKAELAETAQWAKENPVIGSAASVGTSVLSGADYLSKAIETATVGQPVASSTPGLSEITQAIRGGVSEDMSDTGKFFYNTAMSGIDSLVAGLGGSGGAVLLGLGAASSTYNDIKERGGSEKQALVGGAVSGIFESLFEKVSIGNFSTLKEMPVDSLKTLFKNYAKSAGVNFTEEALTEVANIAYDYFAMGDLSQYELMARSLEEQYLAQGMSSSEAKKKAEQDTQMAFLKQVGEAGLSGALMSVGFTTVGAATSEYNAYKTGQGYKDNSAQRDLVQLALQGDKNSQSYKMAENIAAKLDASEDATVGSREIGRLANMMGYEAAKAAEGAEKAEKRERLKTTVMGLGFGAGSSNNKTYNINNTNSLINYAMSFPTETASYQMGEQLKGKKDITSAEEGALIRTISQDIEQGNHKANPAAETISPGGNGNGQVTAEIAPAAAQAAKRGVVSTDLQSPQQGNIADLPTAVQPAALRQGAAASQQIQQSAAETQQAMSNLDIEQKAPGFYSNNRFTGTDEDAQYLDRMAKAAGISIEMAEAKDGSNGWIVNGKAYLSEAAEDPLRVVAKHEITHHLQDAAGEAYNQYRSYVEQIYRDRGTLEQQITAVQQLYLKNGKELSWEAAMDELAADYAGELLENESLIRKLAGEDRSLAQRFLDAIRGLLQRVRTAFSSAEVKQLDRAARLWEAALQEANAANNRGGVTGNQNIRYSIKETTDGRAVAVVDNDILSHLDTTSWDGKKKTQAKSAAKTALLAFKDGIAVNGVTYKVNKISRDEYTRSNYTEMLYNKAQDVFADKMRAAANADDIVIATTSWDLDGELKHPRSDNFVDFARGDVLIQAGVNQYDAETVVGVTKDGEFVLYDLVDMEPTNFKVKEEPSTAAAGKDAVSAIQEDSSGDSISNDPPDVNGKNTSDDSSERESIKGSRDLQKQIDALERQNKRLKEQMKRTDVPKVRREVVKRSAKDLRSMYSSKIDLDVLTDRIEGVYNQLSKLSGAGNLQELDGIPSWEEVRSEMRSIADDILAESRGNVNPMAEEYGEIRRELRGRKISISDEYRSDLESAGGYEGIRKQNFGTFSLAKDGTPIDTVYEELNEKYPTLFPDDIVHPADQLVRLSDVMQELKAVEGNPFENELDVTAQYLAGEIEERFYDTPNKKPTLADKMANTYHRQRLKDQKELRAKLADQRRAYEEQVDGIHARYATENRKRIENQNAAQRRETIYRHATRLGKMLERPTDKRHIPEQLRGAALHMLRYINTESNYQLAYGEDAKYHRVAPGEVLGAEETGRTAAAIALRSVYDDILKKGELSVDPDIGDYLKALEKMGNKRLLDMSKAELDTVWRVMQVVEHSITRANELHGEGRYRTVEGMANALREGVGNRKDRTNWASLAGPIDQLLSRDMITPETFFHALGDAGENIFRQMRRSADQQTSIIKEGSERAAQLIRESGVEFKKADKEHHTFQLDGGDLTLSTSQLMELYALNKRKQSMKHIYIGGLKSVGGVKGLKETGRSKPVKVTPADVATMLEVLTDEQKDLMDGLQAYLSGDLAKHGNEESMKVYGYEKFKEKNYWPIKVSRTETESDPTSETRSKTIPGYGMTKNPEPNASNSVELRSAIDTFAAHLNQMATYASWLGTNEDVTRLHNFKFTDDQMHTDGTVKELFERVYGKKGSAYLDALLSDIAQGTKTGADKTILEGMFGRWKAAKVGGNLRVIVQQPTAILRAMSVVDPKYLATTKNPLSGWKKALKYSQIAQWKDWGYFEMDTGRSIRELITGTESKLDKAKNAFMWGAGAADSVSWGHLWNAVEAETAAKHKELVKGSKEFYEAVADRFAEVVDRTQVVDSVLHRTQIMRSNSYGAKILTSFMSEPSKIYNMVVRDLYDLKNAVGYDQRKAAGKQLARTSSALIISFAVNAAAQALVDGLRDDDRDKKYGEKFMEALPGNFASNFNLLGYIPILKDVWSICEGYTIERSDLEGIADAVNAVIQLGKAMKGNSEKTVLNAGLNAACRLGDLIGIPVSNLKRDAEAIFNTVLIDAGLQELQYKMDKLLYNPEKAKGVFVSDLYRAMDSNPDAYNRIWKDMQTMPIEDIESSMESRMKKELGLSSVKSLPIRYSAPGEDREFDNLMRQASKNHTNWYEELPDGSVELAQALDALGTDATKLQRVVEIGESQYDNDVKYAALQLALTEAEFDRFEAARSAGISIKLWTDIYEEISRATIARKGRAGSESQDDVEKALNKFKLTDEQWRVIWKSYGWKSNCPR